MTHENSEFATDSGTMEPLCVSGEVLPPPPQDQAAVGPQKRRKHIRLVTVDDVRAEMAKLYRAAKAGEIATQDATRYTYMLATLGRLIEVSDLEKRLAALETQAQEKQT